MMNMFLKVLLKSLKIGPSKYREFSAAPTVDPTMGRMHLNKRHIHDLAPVSK